jgi:cation diffusion facilitator CzcD-associated flavoprotein CzcO
MNMPIRILHQRNLDVAIIGAGPYGLSIAAHLRAQKVHFRIFGRPMHNWLAHMPKGMLLKSDGFASNLSDPDGEFTLKYFCTENRIDYGDTGIPVRLETFVAYGLAFQERMVPELEQKAVVALDRSSDGFLLRLDDGEIVAVGRVVIAVGLTHFAYVPASLAPLPPEFLSHSSDHHNFEAFRGSSVTVIGGGASALDFAGLLSETGVAVQLVARQKSLKFHSASPIDKPRSRWQRLRRPQSGIGPGLRARFFTDAPLVFHYLPESVRLPIVRKFLGPAGGWFAKAKVVGRVPLLLGYAPEHAEVRRGRVHIHLLATDGSARVIVTDHIVAGTGYRVDVRRLTFLNSQIRLQIRSAEHTPILSSNFESSVPGLHFVGPTAANSFGPMMRFAFGADFSARRFTASLTKGLSRQRTSCSVARVAT